MTSFQILALLVTLTALFSYLNFRFIRLPTTIGVMFIALLASLGPLALGHWRPGLQPLAAGLLERIDFVLRKLGHPLPGAYDIVKMAATVTIACGLPDTTAVKGHVAVEFFYDKLSRRGRVVADTVIRVVIKGCELR